MNPYNFWLIDKIAFQIQWIQSTPIELELSIEIYSKQ